MRLALALAALLLTPAAAAAAPALSGEFPVDAQPKSLAIGPDGNVWFIMQSTEFGRITPDGTVSDDFALPGGVTPSDITGSPTRLWIAHNDGIVEVDPADPAGAVDHAVVEINTARGIVRESADGDLWVVDDFSGSVVEVGSDGTFKREIPGESLSGGTPSGREIALGSDGRLWWIDFGQTAVQATNPATGTSEAFPIGAGNPQDIVDGPAGQLAFSSPSDTAGRIATADGSIQTSAATGTDLFGVAFGNDGAYWFAEFATDTLGRLTTDGVLTHPITFPADAAPRFLARGANDTLWVSLQQMGSERIARITGVSAPPPPDLPPPDPAPLPPSTPFEPLGPPLPPRDTTAPVLGPGSIRPSAFRVGERSVIRFTLSEAASLTLRFERVRPGRRRGGRCVPPHRAPRGARCRRFVSAGTLSRSGSAGPNVIVFRGRVDLRRLPAGAYRLTLLARDAAGNASAPRRLTFVIRRRRGAS